MKANMDSEKAEFCITQRGQFNLFLAVLALVLFSGCSTFDQHKYVFWGDPSPQHPETLQDHWTDYGPFLPDDRSMKMRRGKAGVLRFYKKNDYEHSIPVDGELVIYVFKGIESGIELTEPEYKLIVSSEQLNQQRKYEKKTGFSYHIWLDLGEIDLPPEQISILSIFTETKTHEQVASGITYTQIGGEETQAQEPSGNIKKALDEASRDPNRQPIPEYSELSNAAHNDSKEDQTAAPESNQVLSVDLSDELVARMAAADPVQPAEVREPIKTAYSPIQNFSDPPIEPLNPKKLTFEDVRSIGSPASSENRGYYNHGVVDQTGTPVPTESNRETIPEPNLLEPSAYRNGSSQNGGMAKVTFN